MNKRFYLSSFSLLLCLFFLVGCTTSRTREHPAISKGVLDLRGWDFEREGNVELSGEWQFYWKQLLHSVDFDQGEPKELTGMYMIPNTWNNYRVGDETLGGEGYATFVLNVLIDPGDTLLAFKIQDMDTAYTLYVEDQLVASNGVVGISRETMVPEFRPMTVNFNMQQDSFKIILQISNYYHRRGGPWSTLKLGSAGSINKEFESTLVTNGFMIGSIFIMALYHLFLFLLRRNESSYLYFGIFCGLITLRSFLVSERLMHIAFPSLDWELLQKLEYLSFYLAVPAFVMFVESVFPEEFNRRVLRIIQGVSVGFSLIVLFTRAFIFTSTVNAFQVVTVLGGLYVFYVLYKAFRKKREGIQILVGGYLFLFATIINEILFVNELLQTGYSISMGMFVFIFSQAFMLSRRTSYAFTEIEEQKLELTETNVAYKKEIVSRQVLEGKLRKSLQDFDESRYALIMGLAKLAEYRDEDTGTHLERMREYVKILTRQLKRTEKYRDYITEDYILDIYQSSILHDIGKVGIRDSILLKPGKLTEEEFAEMKSHSTIGGDAIKAVEEEIQVRSFLNLGREIAYHHHEKWNGKGYPFGLEGEKIPLSARITALADVYDALTSIRPYKKAFSHEKAAAIIYGDSGSHFDPEVVEAFRAQENVFDKIRDYLKD